MHLLRRTEESITDVCLAVGYTSLGTFSRTFAEIVGQPPSAYRAGGEPPSGYVPGSFTMRWTRPADPPAG